MSIIAWFRTVAAEEGLESQLPQQYGVISTNQIRKYRIIQPGSYTYPVGI